jgi:hypothetical protein
MNKEIEMIDYKYLHTILLNRKRALEDFTNEVSPDEENIEMLNSAYSEIAEIENMLVSIRNLYRRENGYPVNWEFRDNAHPILDRKKWEKCQVKRKEKRSVV